MQFARAMTLIEVLAVIVMLGIIAGMLTAGFYARFDRGKHELARTGVQLIASHVEMYRIERDVWPSDLLMLSEGHARPSDSYFLSPDRLLDPWGGPYQLRVPGRDAYPYEVVSLGADRAEGGSGNATDVTSIGRLEAAR